MTADNYADTEANFVCDAYVPTYPCNHCEQRPKTDNRTSTIAQRSCKAEPPSEGEVLANIVKERQNTVHEALAAAVDEATATYERMKVRV